MGPLAGGRFAAPAAGRERASALEEVRQLLPEVLDDIPLAVVITRVDGSIVSVNKRFEQITGYTEADVVGKSPAILRSGWQDTAFYRTMWETILSGDVFQGELVNRRKDGSLYISQMSITPISAGDSPPLYFACVARDVSEQRRSEQRLLLFEAASRAIADAPDLEAAYRAVLKLVCELTDWVYGEAWEAADGSPLRCVAAWHHPADSTLAAFRQSTASLRLAPGVGLPGRVWASRKSEWNHDVAELGQGFVRADGAARSGLHAAFGVPIVADGEPLAVLAFFARQRRQDEGELTDLVATLGTGLGTLLRRRRAEQAHITERNRLAVTLRSIADGVITTDSQGGIVTMNPVAETLTGWTESDARGIDLLDVFNIVNAQTRLRTANPVAQALATGLSVELPNHVVLISKQGDEHLIGDSAAPLRAEDGTTTGAVLVFRDETAAQALERERRKADKLDSLGVLAGGIAHDFNNALTGISAHIALARMALSENSESHRMLVEAEQACRRAASLTRQLLTFSKGGLPIRKLVSLEPLLRQTANFAATGSPCVCEFDFAPGLAQVRVDEGQISQLVHNLVLNATQAMSGGGTIRVGTRNVTVGPDSELSLEPGNYVCISVEDNGPGIPAEHIDRLFDPYFTTKESGSGLGLTVGYSVARNHDGCLTVQSPAGAGATFSLFLPVATPEPEPETAGVHDVPSRPAHILLMDDEESIRRAMSRVLAHLGHQVEAAGGGEEAVSLYRAHLEQGTPYDAIVLDLTVPGAMGGYEAFKRIRELDPAVCAIVSSGYSSDPVMAHYQDHGFSGILPKPYAPSDLSEALALVLRNRPPR